MNSEHKLIPQFNNEDEEREFWATHDSTEYIDWSKAKRIDISPNPKRSTTTTSTTVPESPSHFIDQ